MSRPSGDRAIVDAGLKALAVDSGPPLVCDELAATYERASDEHGRLAVSAATNRLGLGDKIRIMPGHCDRPTPNPSLPRPRGRVRLGDEGGGHIPGRPWAFSPRVFVLWA